MQWPPNGVSLDILNSLFIGGFATLNVLNVRSLLKDKSLKGVHWGVTVFSMFWGFWNLLFYAGLGQIVSFVCETLIIATNIAWLLLAFHYWRSNENLPDREPS